MRLRLALLASCLFTVLASSGCSDTNSGTTPEAPASANNDLAATARPTAKRNDVEAPSPDPTITNPPNMCIDGVPDCSYPDLLPFVNQNVSSSQLRPGPPPGLQRITPPNGGPNTYPTIGLTSPALITVTQGMTAQFYWTCIANCSSNAPPLTWTSGSLGASAQFVTAFNPPVSVAPSESTTETFKAFANSTPGIYPADTCITYQYTFSIPQTTCATYDVEIISGRTYPGYPANHQPTGVMLQQGPIGSSGISGLPGFGHMYIQFYFNGQPGSVYSELQAGQSGLYLKEGYLAQTPSTAPKVDISKYVGSSLITFAQNYVYHQNNNNDVPFYISPVMNSNSWIDGLLLSAHVPQSQIDSWVATLEQLSGKNFAGYENGSHLLNCFLPPPGAPRPIRVHPLGDEELLPGTVLNLPDGESPTDPLNALTSPDVSIPAQTGPTSPPIGFYGGCSN